MITQKARDVRTVEPLLHLPGGIGGIGHTRLEIVEEIAHQQQMIMRLSLDDSVSDLNFTDTGYSYTFKQLSPDSRCRWHKPCLEGKRRLREAYFNSSLTKMVGISV